MHYLPNLDTAAKIISRLQERKTGGEISYATVRDYCESTELLPQITGRDGDLKNVQRPWAVKTVLRRIPPPARVLEIGGGEPIVSGLLSDLGYAVTLVDPYDGFANGPTEYAAYVERFPGVRILRGYLDRTTPELTPESFDVVLSVSVLEHVREEPLKSCFEGVERFLAPGKPSIHCFDFVLRGVGEEHARENARTIFSLQNELSRSAAMDELSFERFLVCLNDDLETFYLSPQGHDNWRGNQRYDEFPFRRVASVQTIAYKAPILAADVL